MVDREMVELPRDRDGVPINVGDEVYTPSGNVANVTSIRIHVMCSFHGGGGVSIAFPQTDLTHARPDSLERIADELDKWSKDSRGKWGNEVFAHAYWFADRIRKLAEREDENGN